MMIHDDPWLMTGLEHSIWIVTYMLAKCVSGFPKGKVGPLEESDASWDRRQDHEGNIYWSNQELQIRFFELGPSLSLTSKLIMSAALEPMAGGHSWKNILRQDKSLNNNAVGFVGLLNGRACCFCAIVTETGFKQIENNKDFSTSKETYGHPMDNGFSKRSFLDGLPSIANLATLAAALTAAVCHGFPWCVLGWIHNRCLRSVPDLGVRGEWL